MTRPLTDREKRIIRETPELGWPEDAWTEATHLAGQVPDRLIARLAARMNAEGTLAADEFARRQAETLARIDAQFARSRGRFGHDVPPAWMIAEGFLGWTALTIAVAGLALICVGLGGA